MRVRVNGKICIFLFLFIVGSLINRITGNMTISLLFLIIGTLYGMILAWNNNVFAIWVLLILGCNWWGLVPLIPIGSGTLYWNEISVLFSTLLFLKYIKSIRNYKFGIAYIILFLFIGVAIVQSNRLYDQSIMTTLLTSRFFFNALAFWPIVTLMKRQVINQNQMIQIFEKFVKISLILYLATWILENVGLHITYYHTGRRFGVRIYLESFFVIMYSLLQLYYFFYKSDRKSLYKFFACVGLLTLISQSRIMFGSAVITFFVLTLTCIKTKKVLQYEILILIFISIMVIFVPPIRQTIINTYNEIEDSSGTIAPRVTERLWFDQRLQGNQLLGVGIPNNHEEKSMNYSGMYIDAVNGKYNNYFLVDLGAYEIRYEFGIVAYILFYILLAFGIMRGFRYRRKSPISFASYAIFIYVLIASVTVCYLIRSTGFVFAMIFLEMANIKEANAVNYTDFKNLNQMSRTVKSVQKL